MIVLLVLIYNLRSYKSYTEKSSFQRGDATETNYLDYQGNLLKYSKDGAFYTKYNGDLIWNYTYEMSNPQIDICGKYILIYDKKGSQAAILTNNGFIKSIKISRPIVEAGISKQGIVGVLSQEQSTGYIQLYDNTGKTLASGELHMENNGYPLAMDISDDGKRMAVSQLDMNGGDVKSTVAFYNFGKSGRNKIDNIMAQYSFANQIIPEIRFLENSKVIAFGDSELVLFDNDDKASISKEIFVEGEIKNIFYNNKYFGTICNTTNEKGGAESEMRLYSQNGIKKYTKVVDRSYTRVAMLHKGEVWLTNGKDAAIYTVHGIKKFAYSFEAGIYKIIAGDSGRRYYFVTEDKIENVFIK